MDEPLRLFSVRFMRAYLPVLLWMILIFVASTNLGSSQNTSRFIGPILRWFNPEVSDQTIRAVQMVVRKGAHVTEYAILAILMWRSRREALRQKYTWDWREAPIILAVCAFYATTDEFHQSFVSTRYGNPWDVLLDTVGAAAGLAVVWFIGIWWKRRPSPGRVT